MATKPAKPAAAKPAAPAGAAEAPAPNKKKLIIIIAAAVLAIGGGGAAWYFTKDKGDHAESSKKEVAKEPKFIPLETFTVNLQHEESDQYLQINISLKVMEPELEDKIKAVLPEVRSKLNLLLSSKKPSELATIAGKKKLAAEIAAETNSVLGIHNPGEPAAAAASAPAASAVAAAPAEPGATGEAASTPAAEGAANQEPVAEHTAEAPAAAAGAEKKGVVDVLFTSFIIQ